MNDNKKSKSTKKTSAYGRSIDYIVERRINLGNSIKGKIKEAFLSGYSKVIDHITANKLFPTVLNDKEDSSPPSKGNCINFNKLLKQRKSDTKWIENDNVENIENYYHCSIDNKNTLRSLAAPLDVCTNGSDLLTDTFVPMAVDIIDSTHFPAVTQIQDSYNRSGDMVWETTVDLSSIMIPNEFLFGGKSKANNFHKEDTNDFLPIETCLVYDDTIVVHNLSHQNFDNIRFYNDPYAQINNSVK